MSQRQIYDFLNEHKGKWYDSVNLGVLLNISRGTINTNLKKLREAHDEVQFKIVKKNNPYNCLFFYRIKK